MVLAVVNSEKELIDHLIFRTKWTTKKTLTSPKWLIFHKYKQILSLSFPFYVYSTNISFFKYRCESLCLHFSEFIHKNLHKNCKDGFLLGYAIIVYSLRSNLCRLLFDRSKTIFLSLCVSTRRLTWNFRVICIVSCWNFLSFVNYFAMNRLIFNVQSHLHWSHSWSKSWTEARKKNTPDLRELLNVSGLFSMRFYQ
jgi:hypothetical protein